MNRTPLYKDIIVPIVLRHLPNAKIILFGSRARGDFSEGADIDVALDIGRKIDRMIMIDILDDLEESALPINFDVLDFHAVSDDMRASILKDGILWN